MKTIRSLIATITLAAITTQVHADDTVIRFVHKEDMAVDKAGTQLMMELIKEFEKLERIQIQPTFIQMTELRSTLLVAAQDGDLPDVVLAPGDFIGLRPELKLSEIPPTELNPSVEPAIYQTATMVNKVLGEPISTGNHMVLYYNKKYVKHPIQSLEELAEQKKDFLAAKVAPLGWNYGEMFWFLSFSGAFGVNVIHNGAATLNTPEMQHALTAYKTLATQGIFNSACTYTCVSKDFIAGSYAYAVNGDWAYNEIRNGLGSNFGVALLPMVNGKPMVSFATSQVLLFPNNSLRGEKGGVLKRFAKFLQSAPIQERLYRTTGKLPVNIGAIALAKHAQDENGKAFMKQLELSAPLPTDRVLAFVWDALSKGTAFYLEGGVSAEEAAKTMQEFVEREQPKPSAN